MRVREFLLGRRVDLALDCTQQECAARIRAALPAHEWPLGINRVAGQVGGDRVVLRYKGGVFDRRNVPELSARILGGPGGARLSGKFGVPPILVLGLMAFTCVALVVAASVVRGAFGDGRTQWSVILLALLFPVVPWGIAFRDAYTADRDWERILAMLDQACGLR